MVLSTMSRQLGFVSAAKPRHTPPVDIRVEVPCGVVVIIRENDVHVAIVVYVQLLSDELYRAIGGCVDVRSAVGVGSVGEILKGRFRPFRRNRSTVEH